MQQAYIAPDAIDDDEAPREVSADHLDALSESWAAWCRTRRFFGRVSVPVSLLGKLRSPERGRGEGGPNGVASAELAAFNLAVRGQPDGPARRIFEAHYLWRCPNVSKAAAAMGVSRSTWYAHLGEFRRAAYAASRDILAANLAAAGALPSQRAMTTGADCTAVTTPSARV